MSVLDALYVTFLSCYGLWLAATCLRWWRAPITFGRLDDRIYTLKANEPEAVRVVMADGGQLVLGLLHYEWYESGIRNIQWLAYRTRYEAPRAA